MTNLHFVRFRQAKRCRNPSIIGLTVRNRLMVCLVAIVVRDHSKAARKWSLGNPGARMAANRVLSEAENPKASPFAGNTQPCAISPEF